MTKLEHYIGTIINGFEILEVKREKRKTYVFVPCPYCGKRTWKRLERIQDGTTKSCGCKSKENRFKSAELKNKHFGRLKAISPTQERAENSSIIWLCECECGNFCKVSARDLIHNRVQSCGCFRTETQQRIGKELGEFTKKNFCVEGTQINNLSNKLAKNNTSGIKGVHWDKNREKWVAQIEFKGKKYYLGRFDNKEDAAEARKKAEDNLFGNFLKWYASEYPERWEKLEKRRKKKEKEKNETS